jgi:G:T-mismatch repair DNA endonuclease (very short patch repair protein)
MKTKEERLAYYRERESQRRQKENYYIDAVCRLCKGPVQVKKYAEKYYRSRGGGTCKNCLVQMSSIRLHKLRASQTTEETSAHAKFARSKADCSKGVENQWKTFRSNPKKYKEICLAKSKRMEEVWENYPEETRNHIIAALAGSNNCGRSKISEEFKRRLIDQNLYSGFVSEEVFHGFIPDEINHKLKIIIEVYGDLYHCNPIKYKNPNVFVPAIQRTVGEQWKRDEKRLASYLRNGYTVVIVWENEIRKRLDEAVEKVKLEIERKRHGIHAPY